MKNLLRLLAFSFLPFLLSAQNYFEPLGGPIGLDVKSSFKDVNGGLYIKAGGMNKHQKSLDDGDTWAPVLINDSIQAERLYADEVPNLYAVDGGGIGSVYRYNLNEDSWDTIFSTSFPSNKWLSISPAGDLFLSAGGELHRSSDKGNSWTVVSNQVPIAHEMGFHPNGDMYGTTVLSNKLNLVNSWDSGGSWESVFEPIPILPGDYQLFHISMVGNIYVKHEMPGAPAPYFSMSCDNGNNFELLTGLGLVSPMSVLATNNSEDIFYSLFDKVYMSKDKGQTWTDISSGIPNSSLINHIYIDDDQYIYLSLNNDVLYKSFSPSDEITPVDEMGNEPIFDFKIFSNPATDYVSFQLLTHQDAQPATFRIIDASGRVVQEIERTVPNELHTVPVSGWAAGVYFLQYMENGEIRASERFLVLE